MIVAVDFETVAREIDGVPFMSGHEGRIVYEHVRRTRPEQVLDLGTAHGVSAAYIAAALEANGRGHVTSVESSGVTFDDPAPAELIERIGLAHRVTFDRSYSTYTWFLKEQIEARSDNAGNCEPLYDFCYLDGAKEWTIDGLAVLLVEKAQMSQRERSEPHIRAVFDLILKQHPSFTNFRIQDGWWAWAQKAPGQPRRMEIETTRSLRSFVVAGMRHAKRRVAARS
jgi:hypothetical protein